MLQNSDIQYINDETLIQIMKDFEHAEELNIDRLELTRNAYIARDIHMSRRDMRKIRQGLLLTEEKLKMFFNERDVDFQALHEDALNCNLFGFYYRLDEYQLLIAGY